VVTGWQAPARRAEARAVYAAAEADRVEHPDRYDLGDGAAGRVVERAVRGGDPAGLGDPTWWREGLDAYLASAAEDGRLNALGQRMVLDTATAKLRARRSIAQRLHDRPEIGQRSITPPIVIVGGWRTGSTFLFRLLATDPRLRAPLPAELTAPWRFVDLGVDERAALLDASAAAHDLLHLLNPSMEAVHDSGAHLAEECVLAMGRDLRNWGFSSTVRLESYVRWLADQDLASSYRDHRLVLQLLQSDDRRWVLKAPAHTAELTHLAAAFPGACIVHLHRDIVATVASGASLFATFRSTYSDEVDGADVGRFQADQTALWFRRAAAFRSSPGASTVAIVDIDYDDLVQRTAPTLQHLYARAGLDAPEDLAAMIDRYHAAHPHRDAGAHRYGPADFGLDPDELRERFTDVP
jgi:hypothetical protein